MEREPIEAVVARVRGQNELAWAKNADLARLCDALEAYRAFTDAVAGQMDGTSAEPMTLPEAMHALDLLAKARAS